MIRRPPRSTRTDTPFPYTTRFRSRGIVHSEMPEQEDGLLQGFQLWVNLPAADKMAAPRYQDIEPEAIPEVDAGGGVRVRVIAGQVGAVKGAVDTGVTEPTYLDVHLPAGASFVQPVPGGHNAFVYAYAGAADIGDGGEIGTA